MSDLFSKLNTLGRAIINDAAGNLRNGGSGNSGSSSSGSVPDAPDPVPTDPAAKPPSDAARAAARTEERLDSAISLLQQNFLKVTNEMAELDKQIDAALVDGDDDVARQLTHRLQQQQQRAQQLADDLVRYNVPIPAPLPETVASTPPVSAPPAASNPGGSVSIPVNTGSGGIRVPVRTGGPVNKPTPPPSPKPARPASELLSDRPATPESDAKLAERRRRLSAPDDSDAKKSG